MDLPVSYLLLGLFIFIVNVMPAFMPPTWAILSYFTIKYDLALLPTILIGVICAVAGRVVLYFLAAHLLRRFLSKGTLANFDSLRNYLSSREKITLPFIFAYAFSPIPSNQLFIVAGLTHFNIKLLTFSFFVGRLLSYSFWVGLANTASNTLEEIFAEHFTRTTSIIIEVIGITFLILVSRINWKRFLKE